MYVTYVIMRQQIHYDKNFDFGKKLHYDEKNYFDKKFIITKKCITTKKFIMTVVNLTELFYIDCVKLLFYRQTLQSIDGVNSL